MLRLRSLTVLSVACLAVAGCGGSSGNADSLLKQTFCGNHSVNSGNLNAALTIVPTGSRTLRGPISLSLTGPFQRSSSGKLPQSDLTVTLGAQGSALSAGVISTGGHGYVTLTGSSYELPQSSYQRLESSFSAFASPPGCSSRSGVLAKLHLQPLHWLSDPQVVGTQNMGGASTTHIHAGINVGALVGNLSSLLQQAPTLGLGGSGLSGGLSKSTLNGIADRIQNATFDVWTGTSDKTLRRLKLNLTIPVSGQFSALLGGLSSANISLTLGYSDLNQPQSITAPANLQPYRQLQTKLGTLIALIRGQLSSVVTGGLGGSSSSGSGTSTGSGSNLQSYSACIQRAGNNVVKMQKCAPLLSGK